jgi:hypothetical protein
MTLGRYYKHITFKNMDNINCVDCMDTQEVEIGYEPDDSYIRPCHCVYETYEEFSEDRIIQAPVYIEQGAEEYLSSISER